MTGFILSAALIIYALILPVWALAHGAYRYLLDDVLKGKYER